MTRFRPCIDLHDGRVKQIVGSTLSDSGARENFVSERPSCWYAEQYLADGLFGGHVIMLGGGNEKAATEALAAHPSGLQIGGGIRAENAAVWLERGASHVIVTSSLFDSSGRFAQERLEALVSEVGAERVVLDLSCKAMPSGWKVMMNRWQTETELEVSAASLDGLACYCAEFLIHAVDVEGKCEGIDRELVQLLGGWGKLPLTYAGGISSVGDFWDIQVQSGGLMDATVGSALDMFGGKGVRYRDCVAFNRSGTEKQQLRCVMRSALRAISASEVARRSEALVKALMRDRSWLPSSGVVSLFGGLEGEPDLSQLIGWLNGLGLTVAYMGFENGELIPQVVKAARELEGGPFGVHMPVSDCRRLTADEVGVVLTPGLAFSSADGLRLGRGKGHYDRFFATAPQARRVGVCWQHQLFPSIPGEPHDARMHRVITEGGWLNFGL